MDVTTSTLLETALLNHSVSHMMSSDESHDVIRYLLPWVQIGASGYGFIVDNNGQLVNHHLISMDYIEVGHVV